MLVFSLLVYFIPLFVLGGLLLLFGLVAVLARVRGGRYLRPIFALVSKVPLFRRLLQRASRAVLERENPELARAVQKLERAGADKDPRRAQVALSRMSAAERRAWLEQADEQGQLPPPVNRADRRARAKVQGKRAPKKSR